MPMAQRFVDDDPTTTLETKSVDEGDDRDVLESRHRGDALP
jgi:hypothetical protein